MSSTIGMAGPLANLDDKAIKGLHRSRFSMHLRTRRVRRWLLVQLVSMPSNQAQTDSQPEFILPAVEQEQHHRRLDQLVDHYRLTQPMRRWV